MKKIILVALLVLATGITTPTFVQAKSYNYANYDVDIQINKDASFTVSEKQTFDFTGDYTFAYRGIELNKLDYVKDIEVTDENNNPIEFENYKEDGKQMVKWYYNASDEKRTFIVKYTVHGGLGYFDWDELYWNAVPAERDVDIKNATVTVRLPDSANKDEMKSEVFTRGSTAPNATKEIKDDKTFYYTAKNLIPSENFTIVAGWPKGIIDRTYTWVFWAKKIGTFAGIALPFVVLFLLLRRWIKKGRDPKGKGEAYARYGPPKGFSPLLVAGVLNESTDPKDISANIIDLAIRRYLRIEESESKVLFAKIKETKLIKLKEPIDLPEHEQLLMTSLFSGKNSVSLSQLKNKFYTSIPLITKSVMREMMSKKVFASDPEKVVKTFAGIGTALIFLGVTLLIWGSANISSGWLGIGIIISGALCASFAKAMPQKTIEGVAAKEHIIGFKDYLHTAERFRVQDNKPENFEKFLAYAMVLGVEKEWSKRFANIYDEQHTPYWYVAPYYYSTFNWGTSGATSAFTTNLTQNLSSLSTNLSSAMSSQPSGGSGGSGFGGGGFGGGGGGGGSGGAG